MGGPSPPARDADNASGAALLLVNNIEIYPRHSTSIPAETPKSLGFGGNDSTTSFLFLKAPPWDGGVVVEASRGWWSADDASGVVLLGILRWASWCLSEEAMMYGVCSAM